VRGQTACSLVIHVGSFSPPENVGLRGRRFLSQRSVAEFRRLPRRSAPERSARRWASMVASARPSSDERGLSPPPDVPPDVRPDVPPDVPPDAPPDELQEVAEARRGSVATPPSGCRRDRQHAASPDHSRCGPIPSQITSLSSVEPMTSASRFISQSAPARQAGRGSVCTSPMAYPPRYVEGSSRRSRDRIARRAVRTVNNPG